MSRRSDQGKRRTLGREQTLMLLFTRDFPGGEEAEPADVAAVMDDVVLENYAIELYRGILENQERVDAAIENASENWSISRMALTDRSILRIAAYELIFRDDIPSGVAINEAVELAQRFGGEDDSFRFVNGVLGKIASTIDAGVDPSVAEESGEVMGADVEETDGADAQEAAEGQGL